MNKTRLIKAIFVAMFFSQLLFTAPILAVSKGADQIVLKDPSKNQIIAGAFTVNWLMIDNNQSKVGFQMDLFKKKCEVNGNYVATLADSKSKYSIKDNVYSFDLTLPGKIKNTQIGEGTYCLRVCGIFVQSGNNYYSMCDKNTIQVKKASNQAPQIITVPNNLVVKPQGSFEFQIVAQDPEKQTLTYSLLENSAEFVNISSTGLLSSAQVPDKEGSYEINLQVKDPLGASDEQKFFIQISATDGYVLAFVYPLTEQDTISSTNSLIKWSVQPVTDLTRTVLFYSVDQSEWLEITSLDDLSIKQYQWNIGGLTSGKYYLRLLVEDKNKAQFFIDSNQFTLTASTVSVTPTPFIEKIVISEITPEDQSTVTQSKPNIAAKYKTDATANILTEKIVMELNGDDSLLDCDIQAAAISCAPKNDLTDGQYQLELTIFDDQNNTLTKAWSFTVVAESDQDNGKWIIGGKEITTQTILLALGVLCIGLLILFVPWLFFTFIMRKRRQQQQTSIEIQNDDTSLPTMTTEFDQTPYAELTPEYVKTEEPAPIIMEQEFSPQSLAVEDPNAPSNNDSIQTSPLEQSDTAPIVMPSSYSSEEVPAWLKDFESSQPASLAADKANDLQQEEESGAKLHDDYGLSLNPDAQSSSEAQQSSTNQ